MKKIVITGGAGFAGSHLVDKFVDAYPETQFFVFDKMTYAADVRHLGNHLHSGRVRLIVGDLIDFDACINTVRGADLVIHAAAESHVDNSFTNSIVFTKSNVLGTHCLAEACRLMAVPRLIHVSTDEVIGEVPEGDADENAVLNPTNPYSSSKAAAEMILRSYAQSYKFPIISVRSNNFYGTRQYPEKIIPRFVLNLLNGKRLPVHGDGSNRRHYLHVEDFAEAILLLAKDGVPDEIYNIGTKEEYTNFQIAQLISAQFGKKANDVVDFVTDRPFNDCRYSVSYEKIAKLGWGPKRRLVDNLPAIIEWYRDNTPRYADLLSR